MPERLNDEGIILVRERSHLKALYFAKLPSELLFAGQLFRAKEETLGEYDYLRNEADELIGFSINITSRERKLLMTLAVGCEDVKFGECEVRFVLGPGLPKEVGVQIPTTVYRSAGVEILIAFYKWGDFGKLGFQLHPFDESDGD